MTEVVGTVKQLESVNPPLLWIPRIDGEQITAFRERQILRGAISDLDMAVVVEETTRVLGRSLDPASTLHTRTGLVVGRVQSGKTMSFTALMALAHDNGYGLIVVIAGTTKPLINQTEHRLRRDLALEDGGSRRWVLFKNPSTADASGKQVSDRLDAWLDSHNPPHRKRVTVVVVLKNPTRLNQLSSVLSTSKAALVPTLIIDDEADQAGLNTYTSRNILTGQVRMSPSYAAILRLRQSLTIHSYVQYTATPQAPLLVKLSDNLSPDFAELLTPGPSYVGGRELFFDSTPYIKIIPQQDLAAVRSASAVDTPPSLIEAFSLFVYGCAYADKVGIKDVTTMMVHPSRETTPHSRYLSLVRKILDEWRKSLSDKDREIYIYESLEKSRQLLQKTFSTPLPDARELEIYYVVRNTLLRELNATSRGDEKLDWNDSPFWLVVGGAKLDRGFTVEGLFITYMPRPLGDGNADTVQQRARFMGYKRKQLDFIRIYVDQDVSDAFLNYVEHEEVLHAELRKQRGYPLKEWPRKFLLDLQLRLTRVNVIGINTPSINLQGWKGPNYLGENEQYVVKNRNLIYGVLGKLSKTGPLVASEIYPDFIDKRAESRKNLLFEDISLVKFKEEVLDKFLVSNKDDKKLFESIKILIDRLISSDNEESISIFVMHRYEILRRSYYRSTINPQQGESPPNTTDRSKLTYDGDKAFHFPDKISVQIHFLDIYESSDRNSRKLAENCPWLTFYFPDEIGRRILHE